MKKKVITIASGYFNPVHKGHIELFEKAKSISDGLIVIVNNDRQRELKGSKKFQDEVERCKIISTLKPVDEVMLSIDEDRTVRESLTKLYEKFSAKEHKAKMEGEPIQYQLIFVNGGDQFSSEVAEREVCENYGIFMIDGMGGKIQSSSWLLEEK
jgi:cytidyltransferase-like protein